MEKVKRFSEPQRSIDRTSQTAKFGMNLTLKEYGAQWGDKSLNPLLNLNEIGVVICSVALKNERPYTPRQEMIMGRKSGSKNLAAEQRFKIIKLVRAHMT